MTPNPAGQSLYVLTFGDKTLVFTAEEFKAALERGRELVGSTATAPPLGGNGDGGALLTAEEMESLTAVKSAWFLEGARAGTVPHYRIGRYVRFDLAEVRDSTRFRSRSGQRVAGVP